VGGEGFADERTGVGVPDSHCAVEAGGVEVASVRAECDAVYESFLPEEGLPNRLAGVGIPPSRSAAVAVATLVLRRLVAAVREFKGDEGQVFNPKVASPYP
jgi:hypothetical protein